MSKTKVAGVAAPKEFTSFLRLEYDRALEDGTLAKMAHEVHANPALPWPAKQLGMVAFMINAGSGIPGGIENCINVRVFKNDSGYAFTCTLKRSAFLIAVEERVVLHQEMAARARIRQAEANKE